jgi:hypothetical protein
MSMRGFGRWIVLWWAATIHGVAGAWFGWAAVAAAAFIGYLQQRFNLVKEIGEAPGWFLPVASAFFAFVAALLIHAVVIAPYRAWRMLNPFKIRIISGILKSEYPAERFERQRAAVLIKNKSYRQRSNCVLHVQTVSDFDDQNHAFPKFIKELAHPVFRGDGATIASTSAVSSAFPRFLALCTN